MTSFGTADAVRARVSLTGQFASIDPELTGRDNLRLLARLLGLPRPAARVRADELLDGFGLADAGGRQVLTLSGGMRRRLDIAASLIVRPDLLFLDEPTTGLDPQSRQQTWQLVREIVAQGTTVVLTTQYLDEADQLADRIALIDHGRVIAEGTTTELKASVGAGALEVRLMDAHRRSEAARLLAAALGSPVELVADPAVLSMRIASHDDSPPAGTQAAQALAELAASGVGVSRFALGQPTLDEASLALTGHRTDTPT